MYIFYLDFLASNIAGHSFITGYLSHFACNSYQWLAGILVTNTAASKIFFYNTNSVIQSKFRAILRLEFYV